jgi:hypothetical protein
LELRPFFSDKTGIERGHAPTHDFGQLGIPPPPNARLQAQATANSLSGCLQINAKTKLRLASRHAFAALCLD